MALDDYFRRKPIKDEKLRKEIATQLFKNEEFVKGARIANADKYYAILLMDGDNMGKLINESDYRLHLGGVSYPDIVSRLKVKVRSTLPRPWGGFSTAPATQILLTGGL